MHARVLAQARHFVLHLQLAALQLGYLEIVSRGMRERFVEFFFERSVPFLELRKMRLDGHVGDLLMSKVRQESTLGSADVDARLSCAPQQIPVLAYWRG